MAETNIVVETIQTYVFDEPTERRYLKGRFLGKGGFAQVYEFTSLTDGQTFACKVVPQENLHKSR